MTNNTKLVLKRFAKGLAAAVLAVLATWVASPDVLNLVPTSYQWIITAAVVPGLLAIEKYLGVKSAEKAGKTPS